MWYTWTLNSHGVFCSRTVYHALLFCRTRDLKLLVISKLYVTESVVNYTFSSDIRYVVGNDPPIPHFSRVFHSISWLFLCKYNHISGFSLMPFLLTSVTMGSKLDSWWQIHWYIRRCDILSSNTNLSPSSISPAWDHWPGQCHLSSDWASSRKRPPILLSFSFCICFCPCSCTFGVCASVYVQASCYDLRTFPGYWPWPSNPPPRGSSLSVNI